MGTRVFCIRGYNYMYNVLLRSAADTTRTAYCEQRHMPATKRKAPASKSKLDFLPL